MNIADDELAEQMIIARNIARKIACKLPACVDREELIQQAFFGLADALNRFDPKSRVPFGRFAYPRIRGSVYDFIRSQSPLSRGQIRKGERHEPARSLSEPLGWEDDGVCLIDVLIDRTCSDSEELLLGKEKQEKLCNAILMLPARERTVIEMHYSEGFTLQKIADHLGVCAASVYMIRSQAIRHLREALGDLLAPAISDDHDHLARAA
jgi:RNA polymerase sigma factor FliA